MTARNHHHVSRFYLEGFAGPVEGYRRPMLFVTDMKERWQKPLSPRNVAFVKDFHRIDVDGYAPDALEASLGIWEGKASEAFKRIIVAKSIRDPNDRAYLLNFMALLAVKSPRHRERFHQFHEQLVKKIMDLATATPERWASQMSQMKAEGIVSPDAPDDYERMRQFIEGDRYKVNLTTNFHRYLELETYKQVLQYLSRRNWMLLRAPAGQTGFMTSDHPVCLMWSDPKREGQFKGPGHGVPGTLVIFPLCNELALLGSFEGDEGRQRFDGDSDCRDQWHDCLNWRTTIGSCAATSSLPIRRPFQIDDGSGQFAPSCGHGLRG